MYPGINGRTQGDKKLINPAKKATDNVVFIKYTYSSTLKLSIF